MNVMFITLFCYILIKSGCWAATYDQRQTGDLNVQVDLKDLRIIALMKGNKEEYVDYDYAYDYSEMTIKPQNGTSTTPKPLNGTNVSNTTLDKMTTVAAIITDQTTMAIKSNDSQLNDEVTSSYNESVTTVKTSEIITNAVTEMPMSSTTRVEPSTSSTTRPLPSICKKGFVMNQNGECELKLQSAGNALIKLVKLSQKLKLRRENRRNEDTTT